MCDLIPFLAISTELSYFSFFALSVLTTGLEWGRLRISSLSFSMSMHRSIMMWNKQFPSMFADDDDKVKGATHLVKIHILHQNTRVLVTSHIIYQFNIWILPQQHQRTPGLQLGWRMHAYFRRWKPRKEDPVPVTEVGCTQSHSKTPIDAYNLTR